MIRGTMKNVIRLKGTGSTLFEEAYFIVSDKGEKSACAEADMIREANRIIELNALRRQGKRSSGKYDFIKFYLLGALSCSAVTALLSLFNLF